MLMLLFVLFISNIQIVNAETVTSPSYKIEGLTFGTDGGKDLSSGNFRLNLSAGGNLNDVKLQSASYKIGAGGKSVLQANIPQVKCFETTTSGSTSCDNPAVVPNGMEQVCGFGGCFNRARFEIDSQNNPADTLYSVQISTDVAWGSWSYIDGGTRYLENIATHDINDYLTEDSWENDSGVFNLVGLNPAVTYYIRITALRGDFTESGYSNVLSATTGIPTTTFNVIVADENEIPTTDIDLGLMSYGNVFTGNNYIWLYVGTNASGGAGIYVRDLYNGLRSNSQSYTINSITGDLSGSTGYGLQSRSVIQNNLGPVVAIGDYAFSGDNVGLLSNDIASRMIFSTSGQAVVYGKASVFVKAQPSEAAPAVSDYTDSLYFTIATSF